MLIRYALYCSQAELWLDKMGCGIMSSDHQKYLEGLVAELEAFRRELTKESDRGCALFATAYIDKVLSYLLYVSVVFEPKKVEKDLFEFNSPLCTFSSRIKMAYYLGKISKSVRRDLDLLRKIRNKFAHHPEVVSFDDKSIANICKELSFSFREKKDKPRLHFTGAVFGVLSQIHTATLTAQTPDVKPDDVPSEELKAKHRKIFGLDE